jgi:hypothetical protein
MATFDSILSYNYIWLNFIIYKHISNLTSSCIRKLCKLNRVKDSFDVKTCNQLSRCWWLTNWHKYGSTIWSNASAKNIKKLQTVQNFAARIITKVTKFDHITDITPSLQEVNWLPIELLLLYRDTIMAYKCLNNLTPSYLTTEYVR